MSSTNYLRNYRVQTDHGKCGIYNLANALRCEEILIYEEGEEFIPTGYHQVENIFKIEGRNFHPTSVINSVNWDIEIPKDYLKKIVNAFQENIKCEDYDTPLFIFILTVQNGDTSLNMHAITLYITPSSMAYSDPHDSQFWRINSMDEIYNRYKYVNSVETFEYNLEDELSGYVIFDQQELRVWHFLNIY